MSEAASQHTHLVGFEYTPVLTLFLTKTQQASAFYQLIWLWIHEINVVATLLWYHNYSINNLLQKIDRTGNGVF